MDGTELDRSGISPRDRERIRRLRLMDDDFFRVCFKGSAVHPADHHGQ